MLIPIAFTAVLYAMGVRSRKVLAVPPEAFVLLPVLVVTALYLFRAPIQQGRVLPGLGPALSLVFPATDLYEPLVIMPLEVGKMKYELAWTHKYVGHHAFAVSVPGRSRGMSVMEPKIAMSMEVFEDGGLIFEGGRGAGQPVLGKRPLRPSLGLVPGPRGHASGKATYGHRHRGRRSNNFPGKLSWYVAQGGEGVG